jgi:hypothetical protein
LRELDKVVELYKKSPGVNKMLATSYLEAGMRMGETGSDIICEALEKFIEIDHKPHPRVLKKLSNIKHIPDRLFVILRKNFGAEDGLMRLKTRQFEKPSFREKPEGLSTQT